MVEVKDGDRGHREIRDDEASIVRRIFREYAAGRTPEVIARGLNAELIPGPAGRAWSNTTIRGQSQRGNGILNNSSYIGLLEWNRCSYVKDPRTGRRIARPNPKEKWETVEVPELRIVDDELWTTVKRRQSHIRQSLRGHAGTQTAALRNNLNESHRPRFLLSGLLKCGRCGGNFTIIGKDRFGCATRRQKGTCINTLSITGKSIEDRVLTGLKERLVTPELFSIFVQEFQVEYARKQKEVSTIRDQSSKQIADIDKRMKAMMDAIEDGLYQPEMKERLKGSGDR